MGMYRLGESPCIIAIILVRWSRTTRLFPRDYETERNFCLFLFVANLAFSYLGYIHNIILHGSEHGSHIIFIYLQLLKRPFHPVGCTH